MILLPLAGAMLRMLISYPIILVNNQPRAMLEKKCSVDPLSVLELADPPFSEKSIISAVLSHPLFLCISRFHPPWIMKYCNIYYGTRCMYMWTCPGQTWVVQGSIIYIQCFPHGYPLLDPHIPSLMSLGLLLKVQIFYHPTPRPRGF